MKQFYAILLLAFCIAANTPAKATIDTLAPGAFIINMGVVPQTIGNGLKPYGLVYKLVKEHRVPVKWVVNPSKSKDGIDFVHNGVQYRGGTFIIPFEYRTAAVNEEISAWQDSGVVGNTSVSTLILDVTKTIYYAPNWTMDKQNGMIVAKYFENAGIPMTAYGGDSSNWKNPSELGACDDIFVLPHADPTWENHKNLLYWNQNFKGNLWVACHAVSELESIKDPVTGVQLNFLSTDGLVDWSLHKKDATPPYTYSDHGNPIMQFVGTMDNAANNGSERLYLPKPGSTWRPTTTVSVYDPTPTSVPALSGGPAAVVAYGRAFGDEERGYVMYQAGHDHCSEGSEAEQVAAQRAFFNYSFYVAVDRYAAFETSVKNLPEIIVGNETYNLNFDVPAGIDLNYYTITWSSSGGGTFTSTGDKASIQFTAPSSLGAIIVTVTITDGCGRDVFSSSGTFVSGVLPGSTQLQGNYQNGQVQLKWTEKNNESVSYYEVQRADNNNAFKTLAIVITQEKSGSVVYNYADEQSPTGSIKYRLKIVNRAKKISYSNTVKVSVGGNGGAQLAVLGNPVRGTVAFEYRSPVAEQVSAVVMDMNGRIIISKKWMAGKGSSVVNMGNLNTQPAGMYLLRVQTGAGSIVRQVQLVK